jgi:hypothetical protein
MVMWGVVVVMGVVSDGFILLCSRDCLLLGRLAGRISLYLGSGVGLRCSNMAMWHVCMALASSYASSDS